MLPAQDASRTALTPEELRISREIDVNVIKLILDTETAKRYDELAEQKGLRTVFELAKDRVKEMMC